MPQHVVTALIGLVAALLAWKLPALGDQGSQQAALAAVTFALGWLRPAPGQTNTDGNPPVS